MKILLTFALCLISDGGASKEVTGYSGGGVLIKCKYDAEFIQNKKYFCKRSSLGCSDQIKTEAKNEWIKSGRFSLFDDTKSAEFRVMIRELTVQDTGMYQCGVDISLSNDIYILVELKVKKGSLISREVSAYAGGGVNIKCRYEAEYKDKPKSFCKIGTHQWCFNRTATKLYSEWSHDGRFSIHDNRGAGFFRVFIRQLITEDTGTYACAVAVSDEIETRTVVKLNVTEDLSYKKSIIETIHVGGDLSVSCKYPESLRNDPKFLCKRLQTAACPHKTSVKENGKDVNMGKFSLYDDSAKQTLNMTMKNVTQQDSGEYWCGAEVALKSDHVYKVYFTQINLTVTATPSKPTKRSVVSLSSSSSSSSWPTPTFAPTGLSPVSIVITVLVNLLIGLLIGSICLFVTFRIKRKIRGSTPSLVRNSVPGSGNSHGDFKDTKALSASETGTSTGYSTAQLPTSPSDPSQTVYANPLLSTSPCDSANTASAAQLPTSLSDFSVSAVEKSADLTYATVNFHTNATSSDNAAPKIKFKKEEESCEYATVSHGNSYG
ncbi:polymeric immunoglobulin receptor isoform X1 [Pangasianodon hypophthalmus]|uniref:polymeric immunoglobulin receptor isoform X1 n=1 Tax=Pangasianodon hypophthalmus TaxID=310915 RepID=UPI0023072F1E|nr:polymeric immunoglobulin receptor isoform X1 [Pangasianodon hypophthalmus]